MMVEQRVIIDNKLYAILMHEGHLDERREDILPPVKIDEYYFANIPNYYTNNPLLVKEDSEIKVVYFSRKSNEKV